MDNGPEWQLETNAKHHESAAIDCGKNAEKQLIQAEHHRKMAKEFRDALEKLNT